MAGKKIDGHFVIKESVIGVIPVEHRVGGGQSDINAPGQCCQDEDYLNNDRPLFRHKLLDGVSCLPCLDQQLDQAKIDLFVDIPGFIPVNLK